jgi:hypothetical protein
MLVDAPLAARRASMTRVDGAKNADGVCIAARTGASIRGSSMATQVLGACRRRASRLSESFRDAWLMHSHLGLAPSVPLSGVLVGQAHHLHFLIHSHSGHYTRCWILFSVSNNVR